MDCQRCTQMLDDPERALSEAAARTESEALDACCEQTLGLLRLERGITPLLATLEPPSSLDEMILKAARARVAGVVAPAPNAKAAPKAVSFAERLRRWVTAPQVAMATITALAVVIGVFYVPVNRSPMEAHGDTVMSVPSDARSESAPFEPSGSMPLDLSRARPAPAPKPPAEPSMRVAAADTARSAANEEVAEVAAEQAPDDMLALAAHGESEADEARPATLAAPMALAPATAPSVARSARAPAEVEMASAGGTSGVSSGASSGGAPASATVAPSELLSRARAARSRSQCALAIPLYERYLESTEATSRGEAMLELGGCYVASGRTASARRIYERATSMPAVASRARVELESLEARARTSDAPASTSDTSRTTTSDAGH